MNTDRFRQLLESSLGNVKPLINEETVDDSIEKGLRSVLNTISRVSVDVRITDLKKVCNYCKSTNVSKQPNTDKVASMINDKLSGLDNPLNLMGGGSVADSAKDILYNIKGAVQLCSLLKYYNQGGEDFYTAVEGDATGKLDTVSPVATMIDTFHRVIDMK